MWILWGSLKNLIFKEVNEKSIYRGELPKKGGFGQFANLRGGGLGEKEGVVFLTRVDTPMHTKTKMLKDVKRKMLKSNYISNFIWSHLSGYIYFFYKKGIKKKL